MVNKDVDRIIKGLKKQTDRLQKLVAEAEGYGNTTLALHLLDVMTTVVKARVALERLQGY